MLSNCYKLIDSNQNYYILSCDFDYFVEHDLKLSKGGSMDVFTARLLGLNYADYCRLLRDEYGAKLSKYNSKSRNYITIHFPEKTADLCGLVALLNTRMNEFVKLKS